ncbi:sugar isomerase (sis) [Lucifera butyrica]|uniref:Sugar isomerase (Sis) n=1 Tax=Lucifera butyrica TaxID=1351585 RepID=A0A498RHC2_9FIRM|nr:SIS domain-containing protein [Lucifera butyrica]VBB08538.1 sugar isomerase (sis) [Lucifera butyrica]
MCEIFGFERETVLERKSGDTVDEILRQPDVWKSIYGKIVLRKEEIKNFIMKIGKDTRVIFTGAGSSGFIGDALAPLVRKELGFNHVESIHTTDIVANPEQYLIKDIETLLISFGRSGNSPESVAAIQLAEKMIDNVFHIVITCNSQGELAGITNERTLNFKFDEAHDNGFAMTSSTSGMLLAAYSILNSSEDLSKPVDTVANYAEAVIESKQRMIASAYQKHVDRMVVLGAGNLFGIARESALKLLELTAGKIISRYDTPMGFRHGPKAMLTPNTVIMYFVSNNEYTQKYDMDMIRELSQSRKHKLLIVSDQYDAKIKELADIYVFNSEQEKLTDAFTFFIPLLVAQIFALYASLQLGCTPDNPFPSGEVNKVVQGVSIHI